MIRFTEPKTGTNLTLSSVKNYKFQNVETSFLLVCFALWQKPAFVVQSDVCPTGDQEVKSSIPARSDNILSWRVIMNYYLQLFSSFCWFKKGSCQFLAKECAQINVLVTT